MILFSLGEARGVGVDQSPRKHTVYICRQIFAHIEIGEELSLTLIRFHKKLTVKVVSA